MHKNKLTGYPDFIRNKKIKKKWKRTINAKGIVQYDNLYNDIQLAITNFNRDKTWTVILKKSYADVKNLKTGLSKFTAIRFAKKIMESDIY
jgi:hypothetical protein